MKSSKSGVGSKTKTDKKPNSNWCNRMRSSCCRYVVDGVNNCKYVHIDEYAQLGKKERDNMNMQSLMTCHASILKAVYVRGAAENGVDYEKIAMLLTAWGWSNTPGVSHRQFFESVVKVVVYTLHYDLKGAAAVMLNTLWLFEEILMLPPAASARVKPTSLPQPFFFPIFVPVPVVQHLYL
eukprot:TRINITY_DN30748_c0_g1_i1.p1 TRINITY_DN30748_c0_g1~~TRINITY_DN30748_c0_g1_i1.p1  ORF type:complete len:188 (+),score=23.04 TRINITY_DN30748_c0_g1_i1:23-565(+)